METQLILPDDFLTTIRVTFGKEGTEWLSRVPELINTFVKRWELSSLELLAGLSYNLIMFARSGKHGDVVLKAGVPCNELACEIKYLDIHSRFNGPVCRCLEHDAEKGVILLERIHPGETLFSLSDSGEMLQKGLEITAASPVDPGHATAAARFPDYIRWMERTFTRVIKAGYAGGYVSGYFAKANEEYRKLLSHENRIMLLHGDLHHMNMLRNHKGGWTVIDPKGVFGVPAMESARFIRNQLWKTESAEKPKYMDEMLALAAGLFGVPEHTIAQCVFVDTALSNSWTLEGCMDEDTRRRELDAAVEELEFAGQYL